MKHHHWIIVGTVSLLLDLFISTHPGLFAIGLAGCAMAGLVALGFPEEPFLPQMATFIVLTAITLWFNRRYAKRSSPRIKTAGAEVREVTAVEEIAPGSYGRAEGDGTVHDVKNVGPATAHPGDRCRVLADDATHLEVSTSAS